ncbi:hypothetical protein [Ureibacillus terrenus]|uniref:Uncharacterized protein n=1 Tax=Ureibacillus terrenus TaxID=118246 RepID=A0A540UW12_9BACL|nr:hypothetical protein [Ureibacillus terrenus]TQE88675.1 hypothetical protein FKZ59_13415 [Ureibacillus terrenus]
MHQHQNRPNRISASFTNAIHHMHHSIDPEGIPFRQSEHYPLPFSSADSNTNPIGIISIR